MTRWPSSQPAMLALGVGWLVQWCRPRFIELKGITIVHEESMEVDFLQPVCLCSTAGVAALPKNPLRLWLDGLNNTSVYIFSIIKCLLYSCGQIEYKTSKNDGLFSVGAFITTAIPGGAVFSDKSGQLFYCLITKVSPTLRL